MKERGKVAKIQKGRKMTGKKLSWKKPSYIALFRSQSLSSKNARHSHQKPYVMAARRDNHEQFVVRTNVFVAVAVCAEKNDLVPPTR